MLWRKEEQEKKRAIDCTAVFVQERRKLFI
jgi:hypothetical protein